MAIRSFRIPVSHGEAIEAELNALLNSHRVVSVDRHFVANGELSFWAYAVEYLDSSERTKSNTGSVPPTRNRIDYREVLTRAADENLPAATLARRASFDVSLFQSRRD
jgi:hypothetical protein